MRCNFQGSLKPGSVQIYLDQDLWSKSLFVVSKEGGEVNGLHS